MMSQGRIASNIIYKIMKDCFTMKYIIVLCLSLFASSGCGIASADIGRKIETNEMVTRSSDVDVLNEYMDKVISDTVYFIQAFNLDPIKLKGDILDFEVPGAGKGVLALENKHLHGASSIVRNGDVQLEYLENNDMQVITVFTVTKWEIRESIIFHYNLTRYNGNIILHQGASDFKLKFKMNRNTKLVDFQSLSVQPFATDKYSIDYDPPVIVEPELKRELEIKLTWDLYGFPTSVLEYITKLVFKEMLTFVHVEFP